MCLVYVLTPDSQPLMPCVPAIARLLLKEGKARVLRRTPFTIKLLPPPVNVKRIVSHPPVYRKSRVKCGVHPRG